MSNAKNLFHKKLTEADDRQPPREAPPAMRRNPRIPYELGGGPLPSSEHAQFTKTEFSQLKDVMIFILAGMLGSDLDKQIGQALATGQPLDPRQLHHIMDEARRIGIPESYTPLMQKIFSQTKQ